MGGHGADAVEGGCEGGKDVRAGLEFLVGVQHERMVLQQLEQLYSLGLRLGLGQWVEKLEQLQLG